MEVLSLQSGSLSYRCIMSDMERLDPWCIICLRPDLQHQVLSRFQRRQEAESHLRVLQQMMPAAYYTLMFDSALESLEFDFDPSLYSV
jgi:hypothetical protein